MKKIFPFLFLLIISIPLGGIEYYSLDMGLLYPIQAPIEMTYAPLLPTVGFSIPIQLTNMVYLKTGLDFTATWYGWSSLEGAFYSGSQNRQFLGLHFNLPVLLGFYLPLRDTMGIELEIGGAGLLKWPIPLYDDTNENIINDFYGNSKYLVPRGGINIRIKVMDDLYLLLGAYVHYPLYNLWLDDNKPFWSGLEGGIKAGFGFY